MKNLKFLLLVCTFYFTVSCNSDEDNTANNASFSAATGENQFPVVNAAAELGDVGGIAIVAQGTNGELIVIQCFPAEGVTQDQELFIAYKNAEGQVFYNISESFSDLGGSVTLTSVDFENNKVSGTFNFTGNNFSHGLAPIVIAGSFTNVPIVDSVQWDFGWPTSSEGGINAYVDGVPLFFDYGEVETANGVTTITATTYPTMQYITVQVPENLAPGTYTIGTDNGITLKYGFYGVEATATAGSLELVEDNNQYLWARFNATATDSGENQYTIINGEAFLNE